MPHQYNHFFPVKFLKPYFMLLLSVGPLLTDYYVDRKLVYQWSHQSIATLVRQRYFPTIDDMKQTHFHLASLYLEIWIMAKPISCPARGIHLNNGVNRLCSLHPLLFSDSLYNWRKLSELWYQLLNAGMYVLNFSA